jgi:hypothetical protein
MCGVAAARCDADYSVLRARASGLPPRLCSGGKRLCEGVTPHLALAAALIPGIDYLGPDISCAEYLMPSQRQSRRKRGTQSFKLAFAEIGCNESALLQRK